MYRYSNPSVRRFESKEPQVRAPGFLTLATTVGRRDARGVEPSLDDFRRGLLPDLPTTSWQAAEQTGGIFARLLQRRGS